MAQTVDLWGATYSDVPFIDVPSGNGTARFADPSPTTALEQDVAQGKIFVKADGSLGVGTGSSGGTPAISVVDTPDSHGGTVRTITALDISDSTLETADQLAQGITGYNKNGVKLTGTGGGGSTLVTKTITQNGTYNASSDNADGYSSVIVNVSGGTWQTIYDEDAVAFYPDGDDPNYCWIPDLGATFPGTDTTWRITVDGVAYTTICVADTTLGYTGYVGNPALIGGVDIGRTEPFLFYSNWGAWVGIIEEPPSAGQVYHDIKIERLIVS